MPAHRAASVQRDRPSGNGLRPVPGPVRGTGRMITGRSATVNSGHRHDAAARG